jgi:ketosteroid isomerase-like protein
VVADESTPDLVARWRQMHGAVGHGDLDTGMRFYSPQAVWDGSALGIGTFEGVAAIRSHFEDFIAPYEEFEIKLEECQDLGNGVVFAVARHVGRMAGSTGRVQELPIFISEWVEGMVVRITVYIDIDEAHSAAERLAQERR